MIQVGTPIKITEVADDHIIVQFARPGRIEITANKGRLIAHVYEGATIIHDQQPLITYDSSIGIDGPLRVD